MVLRNCFSYTMQDSSSSWRFLNLKELENLLDLPKRINCARVCALFTPQKGKKPIGPPFSGDLSLANFTENIFGNGKTAEWRKVNAR